MSIQDSYLLVTVTNKAPKSSRTNKQARHAIAKDVRKSGGHFADDSEIGKGVIELYSKGSINSVMTHYHAFNTYHQSVTCEYIGGRGAPRLLSILRQADHSERFHSALMAFEQAKQQWLQDYTREVDQARTRLGEYFDETDYPPASQVSDYWQFTCNYMPIAEPEAFELGAFTEDQRRNLQAELSAAVDRASNKATKEYRERLQGALAHVAKQLRDGKRLHGSLLTNLQTLSEADLNVAADPAIAEAVADIKTDVQPRVAQALADKEDSSKQHAARAADAISKKLAGLS